MPANEYLNLGGGKFSTSRGNVIGWNTVLGQFQAVIAAELDGPRNRDLSVQIIGR